MNSLAETMTRDLRVGLIGSDIGKSLTPAMHMREGQLCGINYSYDLIDLDVLGASPADLPELIDRAESDGFSGLNITHPCKQAAISHVHSLSADADALNSINTIVFEDGRRIGHNTDWSGFSRGFKRGLSSAAVGTAVQLGAGGAGVAVAHAMASLGTTTLHVFDLDIGRAEALVAQLSERHPACRFVVGSDLAEALSSADGLVHATPTGMAKHPGTPLDVSLLKPHQWVAEIVYFPLETELLKQAAALGCRTLSGGGMAVFQAVGAFELFTGIAPDAGRMIAHFNSLANGAAV